MTETGGKGSYFYPNDSNDPDRIDVLRNKFGIRSHSELRVEEYRATAFRMAEIAEGDGPAGNFDKAHLKAIHKHIFQDVYDWAGHTRNESPIVDGRRVEPIGHFSKAGDHFLHGSRLEMGLDQALKPIADPDVLRGSSIEEFAAKAGEVMGELNFVHPFREGNGRAQESFISQLGRAYGHDVDFSVITKPRMIEASIKSSRDPSSSAMVDLVRDATDPGRREAIRAAFSDLEQRGENPMEHNVRTAAAGEVVQGAILGHDDRVASLVTDRGIIAADRADLPDELPTDDSDVTFTARSEFRSNSRDVDHSRSSGSGSSPGNSLQGYEARQRDTNSRERDGDEMER